MDDEFDDKPHLAVAQELGGRFGASFLANIYSSPTITSPTHRELHIESDHPHDSFTGLSHKVSKVFESHSSHS